TLHGHGAIWHVRWREARPDRPSDLRRALFSAHRPLREAAARRLTADDEGRAFLRKQLQSGDVRACAASLMALINANDRALDLGAVAEKDTVSAIRAMAVRALVDRGKDATRYLDARQPADVRLEAIRSLRTKDDLPRLLKILADQDAFLRNAAVQQLARLPGLLVRVDVPTLTDPVQRIGVMLAWRASGRSEGIRRVRDFLADRDEEVRFLAAKWVADEKLSQYRPLLAKALEDRALNVRLFLAYSSALARINGREVSEAAMADYFLGRLVDQRSRTAPRLPALQL